MQLFHFSEDPGIAFFDPRAVVAERPPGREWLNEPLVWAIDAWHTPMYFFPRECPRVMLWPTPATTEADRERWWGDRECRMVAHVEWRWLPALRDTRLYRYTFEPAGFLELGDAGMWVHPGGVRPAGVEEVGPLLEALRDAEVELRLMSSLLPLRGAWDSTMHVSGIRLRNAERWR